MTYNRMPSDVYPQPVEVVDGGTYIAGQRIISYVKDGGHIQRIYANRAEQRRGAKRRDERLQKRNG
ncbi:MAG TPA: hypothetical protein VGX70_02375 [Gemmataceae bacterium]|nr:hypothetical protein [Gemmataceae bacterium]